MELLKSYESSSDGSSSDTELPPTTKRQKLFQKQDMNKQEFVFNPQRKYVKVNHGIDNEPAHTGIVPGAYVSKRKARDVSTVSPKEPIYFKSLNLDAYLLSQSRGMADGRSNRVCTRVLSKWEGHNKPVESLDWHPFHSDLLLSSGFDGLCKIWDVAGSNYICLLSHSPHSKQAVSTVRWLSASVALSGGYDCCAVTTDFITMRPSARFVHTGHVTALRQHPSDHNLFVSGDASRNVQLWDVRSEKPVSKYLGAGGQILDVEFINEGREIVASCDIVRKNAGSKMLLVWEASSTIVKSHQIYDEPFTCPCLRATDKAFLAQSNAGYIIIFNAQKPYKISKFNRFEGHAVDGYRTQFSVSPDGSLLGSCSANGRVYFFHYFSTKIIRTVHVGPSPTITIAWHPLLPSRLACSSWDGTIAVLE